MFCMLSCVTDGNVPAPRMKDHRWSDFVHLSQGTICEPGAMASVAGTLTADQLVADMKDMLPQIVDEQVWNHTSAQLNKVPVAELQYFWAFAVLRGRSAKSCHRADQLAGLGQQRAMGD